MLLCFSFLKKKEKKGLHAVIMPSLPQLVADLSILILITEERDSLVFSRLFLSSDLLTLEYLRCHIILLKNQAYGIKHSASRIKQASTQAPKHPSSQTPKPMYFLAALTSSVHSSHSLIVNACANDETVRQTQCYWCTSS